jgi:hypothetical protein
MAAFPTSIATASLIARTDLVDTVYANDINNLQNEVLAIETTLGVGNSSNSLLYSTWDSASSFSLSSAAWPSLNARISNIERGLLGAATTTHPLLLAGM